MSLSKLSRVRGVAGTGAGATCSLTGGPGGIAAGAGGAGIGGKGAGAGAGTGSLTALAKSVNNVNMSLSESFSSGGPGTGGTGSFPRIIARSLSIPSNCAAICATLIVLARLSCLLFGTKPNTFFAVLSSVWVEVSDSSV